MVWHLSSDLGDSWKGISLLFMWKLPPTYAPPGNCRIVILQKLLMYHKKQRRVHFCSGKVETVEIESVFLLEFDKILNFEGNFEFLIQHLYFIRCLGFTGFKNSETVRIDHIWIKTRKQRIASSKKKPLTNHQSVSEEDCAEIGKETQIWN